MISTFRLLLLVPLLALAAIIFLPGAAPADPASHNDYALELLRRGEYEKGLEQLQDAYSLAPYDTTLRRNLAEAYTFVGQHRLAQKRYREAADEFDHARELFPEEPRYRVMRGIALSAAHLYDAAISELEEARRLGGDTPELFFHLGRVYYDTGDLQKALDAWEEALRRDPKNGVLPGLVAQCRRELAVEDRMDRGYSSRFNLVYDAELDPRLAQEILDTLESAYNLVGGDFDRFPSFRTEVLVYTRRDYRQVTESPAWSGGLFDGKIRLPVGGATSLTPGLKALLMHEYTHVVVQDITHGTCPTWLNEGLAEVEGRREYNPPLGELSEAVRGGGLIPFKSLEGSFASLSGRRVVLAYEESYGFVNYLVTVYGWPRITELLADLAGGMPVETALRAVYGNDYDGLAGEWRTDLLGRLPADGSR